jgi:hypothetical protein
MPIPNLNSGFQQGRFDGFVTRGPCAVVKSFQTIHASHTFRPVTGDYFAVMDQPEKIDSDGARRLDPGDPPPIDTSAFTFSPDADGKTTLGIDGAMLECQDVRISAGRSLWFHWAFARFDWSPFNDFAVFTAYPDDRVAAPPFYKEVIIQSIDLERQSRWYADWCVFSWRPETDFRGTVRWIVSNGLSQSIPSPRPGANARPSALLLDCIEVN